MDAQNKIAGLAYYLPAEEGNTHCSSVELPDPDGTPGARFSGSPAGNTTAANSSSDLREESLSSRAVHRTAESDLFASVCRSDKMGLLDKSDEEPGTRVEYLEAEITVLKEALKQVGNEEELTLLNQQLRDIKAEKEVAEQDKNQLQEQNVALAGSLQESRVQAESAMAEITRLNKQLQDSTAQRERQEALVRQLQIDNSLLSTSLEMYKQQATSLREQLKSLQTIDPDALQGWRNSQQVAALKHNQEKLEFTRQLTELRDKYTQMVSRSNELQVQLSVQEIQCEQQKQEVRLLRSAKSRATEPAARKKRVSGSRKKKLKSLLPAKTGQSATAARGQGSSSTESVASKPGVTR